MEVDFEEEVDYEPLEPPHIDWETASVNEQRDYDYRFAEY